MTQNSSVLNVVVGMVSRIVETNNSQISRFKELMENPEMLVAMAHNVEHSFVEPVAFNDIAAEFLKEAKSPEFDLLNYAKGLSLDLAITSKALGNGGTTGALMYLSATIQAKAELYSIVHVAMSDD